MPLHYRAYYESHVWLTFVSLFLDFRPLYAWVCVCVFVYVCHMLWQWQRISVASIPANTYVSSRPAGSNRISFCFTPALPTTWADFSSCCSGGSCCSCCCSSCLLPLLLLPLLQAFSGFCLTFCCWLRRRSQQAYSVSHSRSVTQHSFSLLTFCVLFFSLSLPSSFFFCFQFCSLLCCGLATEVCPSVMSKVSNAAGATT